MFLLSYLLVFPRYPLPHHRVSVSPRPLTPPLLIRCLLPHYPVTEQW